MFQYHRHQFHCEVHLTFWHLNRLRLLLKQHKRIYYRDRNVISSGTVQLVHQSHGLRSDFLVTFIGSQQQGIYFLNTLCLQKCA